jgi:hypothetical protein
MRASEFVFFAVLLAAVVSAAHADPRPENSQVDSYAFFNDLSKEDALKKARKMANADFARNVYRILVVGKRPATSAYDDYLKERYGVLMTPMAGCVVSRGVISGQEGYNSTMKPLLNRKFGRDIFKEAEQAGRK